MHVGEAQAKLRAALAGDVDPKLLVVHFRPLEGSYDLIYSGPARDREVNVPLAEFDSAVELFAFRVLESL